MTLNFKKGVSEIQKLYHIISDDPRKSEEKEQTKSLWNELGSHFAVHCLPVPCLSFSTDLTKCPWIIHAQWHASMWTRWSIYDLWSTSFIVFNDILLQIFSLLCGSTALSRSTICYWLSMLVATFSFMSPLETNSRRPLTSFVKAKALVVPTVLKAATIILLLR